MTLNKILNFLLAILFSLGLALAIVAPNPITIGCAIFNAAMIGIVLALEHEV